MLPDCDNELLYLDGPKCSDELTLFLSATCKTVISQSGLGVELAKVTTNWPYSMEWIDSFGQNGEHMTWDTRARGSIRTYVIDPSRVLTSFWMSACPIIIKWRLLLLVAVIAALLSSSPSVGQAIQCSWSWVARSAPTHQSWWTPVETGQPQTHAYWSSSNGMKGLHTVPTRNYILPNIKQLHDS